MLVSRCFLHEMISYIFSILWDFVPDKKKGVRRNLHSFARPLTFLACFLRQCSHDIVCFMDIGAADRSFSRKDEERIAGKDT